MSNHALYTIGFTKKNAETFFSRLKEAGVTKIIDVRLNNVSQLAGFAKRDDLIYFLRNLIDCDYVHMLDFAPTKNILDSYKKKLIDWNGYEDQFKKLIKERKIEKRVSAEELKNACLLCSEHVADQCHRRLIAEYLEKNILNIQIKHL
ncbi:DUF488 domain-containing protein [Candidatus Electrothrix aarhusensis]